MDKQTLLNVLMESAEQYRLQSNDELILSEATKILNRDPETLEKYDNIERATILEAAAGIVENDDTLDEACGGKCRNEGCGGGCKSEGCDESDADNYARKNMNNDYSKSQAANVLDKARELFAPDERIMAGFYAVQKKYGRAAANKWIIKKYYEVR